MPGTWPGRLEKRAFCEHRQLPCVPSLPEFARICPNLPEFARICLRICHMYGVTMTCRWWTRGGGDGAPLPLPTSKAPHPDNLTHLSTAPAPSAACGPPTFFARHRPSCTRTQCARRSPPSSFRSAKRDSKLLQKPAVLWCRLISATTRRSRAPDSARVSFHGAFGTVEASW